MGRLSGFSYRDAAGKLKRAGFEFDRQARGSHEIWRNPHNGRRTTLPRHPGDIPEGTMKAIVTQAGLTPEEFLNL